MNSITDTYRAYTYGELTRLATLARELDFPEAATKLHRAKFKGNRYKPLSPHVVEFIDHIHSLDLLEGSN